MTNTTHQPRPSLLSCLISWKGEDLYKKCAQHSKSICQAKALHIVSYTRFMVVILIISERNDKLFYGKSHSSWVSTLFIYLACLHFKLWLLSSAQAKKIPSRSAQAQLNLQTHITISLQEKATFCHCIHHSSSFSFGCLFASSSSLLVVVIVMVYVWWYVSCWFLCDKK